MKMNNGEGKDGDILFTFNFCFNEVDFSFPKEDTVIMICWVHACTTNILR